MKNIMFTRDPLHQIHLTEPKNLLTVTKGRGTGEDGWEGRDKGGEKGGIMISMYNVCGGTGRAVKYREEKQ